jgi:hypothetical protein
MSIARIKSDLWKDAVPQVLSIGHTRGSESFRGLVECVFEPRVVHVRAIGLGCEARASIPCECGVKARVVVGDGPVEMITRTAGGFVEIDLEEKHVVFRSSGVQLRACRAPEVEFPPLKSANQRRLLLTNHDVQAWAVVDEATIDAQANDTIWMGVTPQNRGLYVSASAGVWAAMVRDGQDTQAIAVSAATMRKVRPQAGDVLNFCPDGLTVGRENVVYAVGALSSDRRMDTYPMVGNILLKEGARVRLSLPRVKRLREILRVVNMGADAKRLVPVLFRYDQGHLILWSESATITGMSVVPAEWVSGAHTWEIGLAGESVLATLGNCEEQIDLAVTADASTGAAMIWVKNVVSLRAALRVGHQDIPPALVRSLVADQGSAVQDQAQEEPDGPPDLDHPAEEDLPEPE